MHLENSSCTNHTNDLKISTWHTHLLHCALSQKIKVWWKKWILIDYRSIALFIWRNLNHSMEAVAHIPLFISKKMKCIQQKHLYFIGYFLQGSLLTSWFYWMNNCVNKYGNFMCYSVSGQILLNMGKKVTCSFHLQTVYQSYTILSNMLYA